MLLSSVAALVVVCCDVRGLPMPECGALDCAPVADSLNGKICCTPEGVCVLLIPLGAEAGWGGVVLPLLGADSFSGNCCDN
jgi:hypothetical protein